jgi:hypothetical protein
LRPGRDPCGGIHIRHAQITARPSSR